MRSLIPSLPTFPATPAMPQFAAAIAGCDRTLENEEKRSHILHSTLLLLIRWRGLFLYLFLMLSNSFF
jgi:hypothetical protein